MVADEIVCEMNPRIQGRTILRASTASVSAATHAVARTRSELRDTTCAWIRRCWNGVCVLADGVGSVNVAQPDLLLPNPYSRIPVLQSAFPGSWFIVYGS